MNVRLSPLLAVSCLTIMLYATIVVAQIDQSVLAETLLGSNTRDQAQALGVARTINPDDMESELRMALIDALERESKFSLEQYAAWTHGETVKQSDVPVFFGNVAAVVAGLQDPQAIPALVMALGADVLVYRALVAFGEQAAPGVLAVVASSQTLPGGPVFHALITLRCMVELADTSPIQASTVDEMKRAVEQILTTGEQSPTTLWNAFELAVALDDPALRQIVETFVSDPSVITARGVEREDRIENTQQRAADRLAGVPSRFPCR